MLAFKIYFVLDCWFSTLYWRNAAHCCLKRPAKNPVISMSYAAAPQLIWVVELVEKA
jgi:hypothetical protein